MQLPILPKLHLIARFVLGTVFMLSGALKLISSHQAIAFLSETIRLGSGTSTVLIHAFCFVEMIIGAMLVLGKRYLQLTSLVSSFVPLCFTSLAAISSQNPKSCGCFGDALDFETNEYFFLRNFFLLLISMFILRYSKERTPRGAIANQ